MSLTQKLVKLGLKKGQAQIMADHVNDLMQNKTPYQCWEAITKEVLNTDYPFAVHQLLYRTVYPEWNKLPSPAWFPDNDITQQANLTRLMTELNFTYYQDFHRFSATDYPAFWQHLIHTLSIVFDKPYKQLVDLSKGIESPSWLPDAKMNIVNSCFQANKSKTAILYQAEQRDAIKKITYGELEALSNRIANGLSCLTEKGDRIAIIMPMTMEACALFLGIIKAGCTVVSIADSFSAEEIATRLRIAQTKLIFTQDTILRDNTKLPLYTKIISHSVPKTIVLPAQQTLTVTLREQDRSFDAFLSDNDYFEAVSCDPNDYTTILFSSGTTGEPKAIPWTHTTPIKCASDAFLHMDIKPQDRLCWPTNLGWMMGPWLIYASLINQATIAIYGGLPHKRSFGQFIQEAKVSFLGVVPTLVNVWRNTTCMEGLDWRALKLFASTAECSNADDMLYLMSLAHYRPIIEYCGGTEIGGAYITGTLLQPCAPAAFTTPALGLDFVLINEEGKLAHKGEVALVPPSLGLSTELLNKDHHSVYYANMPTLPSGTPLRRHGDEIEEFSNGFYHLLGRVDDTMKLGGIKVSSGEIESVLNLLTSLSETAAIAVQPPSGGPSQLVIYSVLKKDEKIDAQELKTLMQKIIKQQLNPLFKIHDVIIVDALPRTASNKIMRRVLRDEYMKAFCV